MPTEDIRAKISWDQTGFQQGISEINRSLRLVKSEFQATSASLSGFGTSTEQLKAKSDSLARQIDLQRQKVEGLEFAHRRSAETKGADAKETQNLEIRLNKAKAELGAMEGELKKTNAEIIKQTNGWNQFADAADKAAKSMKKTGDAMVSAGKNLSMKVTAPILAAGTASFKMAMDFEESMSKVTGLVGIAQEQVSEWGQELLKIGPELSKGPKELAEGMFFVTSAGLRGAEALDALTYSAKASAAGLGETATIADIVTSAMNAYGSEVMTAQKATDIMVAAVREGKAEASALASVLGGVLPVASEMGVTFDQVAAAVAAMTRTGTGAAEASTQLRAILVGLLKPAQQAEEALFAMGTSSAELREQLGEEGLLPTLQRIRELTNQYGEEVMARVFPNIRALAGVLDLMGANADENAKIFDALADATGTLDHAFETAAGTARFKWDQALSQLQATSITFGEAVSEGAVPVMQEFTEMIGRLAEWFRGLDREQQQAIIRTMAYAAAIGPALVVTGTLIKSVGAIAGVVSSAARGIGTLTTNITLAKAGMATAGTGAATMGTRFAALGAAAGPIALAGAAIIGFGMFVAEVVKGATGEMKTLEATVANSMEKIAGDYAQTQAAMLYEQAQRHTAEIEAEVEHLQNLIAQGMDKNKELSKLERDLTEARAREQRARHLAEFLAEEEFNKTMSGQEQSGFEDVKKALDQFFGDRLKIAEDGYRAEEEALVDLYVNKGEIGLLEFERRREELRNQTEELVTQIYTEEAPEILKAHQDMLDELGIVYETGTGELVRVFERGYIGLGEVQYYEGERLKKEANLLGVLIASLFGKGVEEGTPEVETATKTMTGRTRGIMDALKDDAYEAGADAVAGMAKGIDDNAILAIRAAQRVTYQINQAMKEALKIASPSRVAWDWGKNVVEGFDLGIRDNVDRLRAAGGIMTQAVEGPVPTLAGGIGATAGTGRQAIDLNVNVDLRHVPAGVDQRSLEAALAEAVTRPRVRQKINEALHLSGADYERALGGAY